MGENMGVWWLCATLFVLAILGMIFAYRSNKKERDKKRRIRTVSILRSNGTIIHGFAEKSPLGGYEVWCEYVIFPTHGVDGGFPNGCPWGWTSWALEEEGET